MGILNKRDFITCIVLFVVTFFSRLYLVEQYQSHWDGPQYSIAIFNYSLENQTPAPPGYPVYIGIAAILNVIIDNPHYSLIFESVFFSSVGVIIVFLFGKKLGKHYNAGVIAACIYISSPVFYFFGLTAYAYGIDAVFYIFFAYRAYCYVVNRKGNPYLLGLSYALLIGLRPQDVFYSWPLFLYVLFLAAKAAKLKIIESFIIGCLAWFIPQVLIVGGMEKFASIVSPIGNARIPGPSFINAAGSIGSIVKGAVLTLGGSILVFVYFVIYKSLNKTSTNFLSSTQWKFFALWIIPPFLFNLFIRSDHAGYQLVYLIPLMLIVSKILNDVIKNDGILKMVVSAILLSNLFLFFRDRDPGFNKPYVPTSFHYSEIRKNDVIMSEKVSYIIRNFDPNNTLILVGEPDYFRPVMYHLYNYLVIQADRLVVKDVQYKNIIRTAKNYKSNEVKSNSNIYRISKNISNIVCFDSECESWYSGEHETVSLGGNAKVLKIPVSGNTINFKDSKIIIE